MSKKKSAKEKAKVKEEIKGKKTKVAGLKGGERVKMVEGEGIKVEEKEEGKEEKEGQKKRKKKSRGKKYKEALAKVDKNKLYSLKEAIALVKKTSISSFTGNLEGHLLVDKAGEIGELNLPHFKGKEKKVAIVDGKTLTKIKEGKIDFEVLLASPTEMKNLVPLAKILGPKGLMPNPKNGTLVKDPVKAAKNWGKGGIMLATEKKAPVIHVVLGKIDQKDEELVANVEELIKSIGKEKIKRMTLTSTMGPGVKVAIG
ncbi:50S ribosomal protein L1 [Candidatus Shapirobacteria bacterium]|nr:50S ribosomal protein L1 [Candidatus Shapirobacteria bacterium]